MDGITPGVRIRLEPAEAQAVESFAQDLLDRFGTIENPDFLRQLAVLGQELPRRLRATLYEFKLLEPRCGICVLSGLSIDEQRIGATPKHWRLPSALLPTGREQFVLVLLGSLLGELMGWATQQDGRLMHNVFPIAEHEREQLGTGSLEELTWHTEDAFHPLRPD